MMPFRGKTKEEIIDETIKRFVDQHPELRRGTIVTEIPAPLKWAGIIAGAVMTTAATAGLFWLVTTVSQMQVTLARMDERMASWNSSQESRYVDLERRVSKLEEK